MADTEREAFEAWAKPQPYWWNGQTYSDLHTQIAWDAWQARAALASRPAEVDDEGLPPLPAPLQRDDTEHGADYFTAEQYRKGQRDAVAADRARMLRKILDCRTEDDSASDYQDKIRALMAAPSHTTNKEK